MSKILKNEDRKHSMKNDETLLELLGNKYILGILNLTSMKDCSATELSYEIGIPIATVYRKLKHLQEKEMIEVSKIKINISGNEEKYYRCLIDEATMNFHDGKISVNIKKFDPGKKIDRIWEIFMKRFSKDNKGSIII